MIAPSQIPRRAGERIKTDRRDCLRLAECSRAGELRAVWIPDLEDEAIRDLARAREDAVHSQTQARQQLKGFLLRHDVRYPGKTSWTKSFHVWLGTLNFGPAGAQTAFTDYQLAVQAADQRVERLTHALAQSIHGWRFEPVVASLQALREAAWHYRFKPRIAQRTQQHQHALGSDIKAVAWKAQLRLARRFAALDARGVQHNKACVAVARELAGFVWAIGRQAMHATNPTAIPTSTQSH